MEMIDGYPRIIKNQMPEKVHKYAPEEPVLESINSGFNLNTIILIPNARKIVGSVYKYSRLFAKFSNVYIMRAVGMSHFRREVERIKPDFIVPWGDGNTSFFFPRRLEIPYILVEQDVQSMRINRSQFEETMIRSASKIITTSIPHADYLKDKYGADSITIPLMPFLEDIKDVELKPKLPGQHLVYAGGIVGSSGRRGAYGYRYYVDIFQQFIRQGWTVHLYPGYEVSLDRISEYAAIGCILHDHIPQGKLYSELSQYTAGFHGYNKIEVPPKSFAYTQTCTPNKTWEYLASGVFTISYNGGASSDIIKQGKWGQVLTSLNEPVKIKKISERKRLSNTINRYEQTLKEFLGVN